MSLRTATWMALGLCVSCSALVTLSPPTTDPPVDAGEEAALATVPDARSLQDAAIDGGLGADAEAGPPTCPLPSLLANRGFESGLSGWGIYYETNATATPAAAHSGAAGVHFCSKTANSFYGVNQPMSRTAKPHHLRAWVRRAIDADAGSQLTTRLLLFHDSVNAEQRAIATPPAAQGWTCIDFTSTGTKPIVQPAVVIAGNVQESTCVDVDDIDLFEVPDGGLPPECACPLLP